MNLLNWNIFNGTRQLAGFKAWLLAWITSNSNNNNKNCRLFSEIFNFPFEPPFCLAKAAKAALQFGAFVGQVKGNTHSANMDTQHTHTCRWEERRQEGACVCYAFCCILFSAVCSAIFNLLSLLFPSSACALCVCGSRRTCCMPQRCCCRYCCCSRKLHALWQSQSNVAQAGRPENPLG